MTPTLVICRGLPGCGKTTRAKAWVAEDTAHRARVNRDDLRAMLHNSVWLGHETEQHIVRLRDALIDRLLRAGVSVVSDDTNLPQRGTRDLGALGRGALADVEVWDMTNVPLEECIRRDAARERSVGEAVIRAMFSRYLGGKDWPLPGLDEPLPETGAVAPYVPVPGTPRAIMVDLDGTLCLHNGRSPYDETRVNEDLLNVAVAETMHAMLEAGYEVIFCSGRSEDCRPATEAWLEQHLEGAHEQLLLMRASGDRRKDAIVKRELFDWYIRDAYDVLFVLDDRQRVVDAWRELGLTVFQVAPGDF